MPHMTRSTACHAISIAIIRATLRSASCASASSIRHALAEMLARGDVHDPVLEGHMITVPEVRMSARPAARDRLRHAARRHATQDEVLAALERNKRYLRGEIAHRVNLKFAPDIRFRIDERFDEAERIEKLLRTPAGPARPRASPTTGTNDE